MPPKITYKSPLLEAAVGFGLGAIGGSILGATEDPVHRSLYAMTVPERIKPLMDEARTVGPLGLGSLIGATALTTAMTSVVLAPVLGEGGKAGAMLGAVGAAGASIGAAAALAGRWSTRFGMVATLAGLMLGALTVGEWHIVNIGLQLPVAYVFAMTNPF
uniref:MFS transporter n=1 Tax=Knipowitschia caucasica TaxID=637954 RepID=A0AAV2MBX3_KNICA